MMAYIEDLWMQDRNYCLVSRGGLFLSANPNLAKVFITSPCLERKCSANKTFLLDLC